MASLAEIRSKLKEQETRSSGSNMISDNGIFPFWNMKEGQSSTIRFLPDGNDQNTFFWVERLVIKLPFAGVKGEAESRPVQVQVPCMEMYGESCPILSEVRGWFKDPSLEDLGKKYWKKRSYLAQGLVVSSDLKEDNLPENPIRRFILGPQIYQLIKAALMDPDMEELPTDYSHGIDFRLNKTSKGGFADYGTSKWAMRSRPLSDVEMHAINQHGLYNLGDFLPKKPSETELKVMKEMFEASVDGEAYDADRWSQYFKPAGMSAQTGDPMSSNRTNPAPARNVPVTDDNDIPFDPEPAPAPEKKEAVHQESAKATGGGAQDILAMIRARSKKD
jgi:hypothetical protein